MGSSKCRPKRLTWHRGLTGWAHPGLNPDPAGAMQWGSRAAGEGPKAQGNGPITRQRGKAN